MGKIIDVDDIRYIYPLDEDGNEGDGMAFESCILDDEIVPPIKAYSQEEVLAMFTELLIELHELPKSPSYMFDENVNSMVGVYYPITIEDVFDVIQKKIDDLKEESK